MMQHRIRFCKITEDNLDEIIELKVKESQQHSVAPNVNSLAEAYVSQYAWTRAIYVGEKPVGFIMLSDDPDKAEYFLWRLMIDVNYQGMGYGSQAVELAMEYVRTRPNAKCLVTSSEPNAVGGALDFYLMLGFKPTGAMIEDEVELSIVL